MEERAKRVRSLLLGLGRLQGGAKQAVHYTDVSPAVSVFAIVKGGSNPFNYLFEQKSGSVLFKQDVLKQTVEDLVKHELLLSPVCIGWKPGFADDQHPSKDFAVEGAEIYIDTPRSAFAALANHIVQNPGLMDA